MLVMDLPVWDLPLAATTEKNWRGLGAKNWVLGGRVGEREGR